MAAAAVAVAVAPRARVARVSRRDARVPRAAATPRAARAVVRRRALAAEARARNVGTVGGDPRKRASSSVARAEAAGDAIPAIPATPATPAVASRSSAVATSSESKRIVLLCAIAMLLASADRTIFSLGSLAIAADLSLNMHALGLLQSSFLWGYGFTQILGGVAADEFGGARVLLVGLGLWSIAVAAIPFCASTSAPVAAMVAARVVFGAASGCALPGSAAAVASYVTPERRAGALSVIFTLFNCGSAFGLLLAGGLISTLGWQSVFAVFGGVGVAWSAFGIAALPEVARRGKRKEKTELSDGAAEVSSGENAAANDAVAGWGNLPGWMYAQLFAIGWCHVCVNWGFFILQSWLPVYLAKDLGFSLGGSGLASALPWFLTAFTCGATGVASDALLKNGAERWKVRIHTGSHTTPFAWCTPFLKDFSRRHSSPALPFQRLTGKTFD